MSVGDMKDQQLMLKNLYASHALCCPTKQTRTPKEKDEFNIPEFNISLYLLKMNCDMLCY
jgi:hypothetical protein